MTPNQKKTRGDKRSLYNRLTPEQRAQVASWLTIDNLTYEDVRALVEEQLGVSTSKDALMRFYSSFAVGWQYSQSAGEAEAFGEMMEGKFDAATIKRAKQLAFVFLTDRNPNVDAAKILLKIVGDSAKGQREEKKLSLEERKVTLLEAKAALADKAKDISENAELSPEEKAAQLRALFGMG